MTLNAPRMISFRDKTAARAWVEQTKLPEGFRPFFDRLLNDEKFAKEFRD